MGCNWWIVLNCHTLHAAPRSDDLGVFKAGREGEGILSYGDNGV